MRRALPVLAAVALCWPAAADSNRVAARSGLVLGTQAPDHIVAGGGNDLIQVAFGGADTVDCGGGNDVVTADLGDRLAHCEVVSRRLSADPFTNPDAEHETAVEPDGFANGATVVAVFQLGRRPQAAAGIGAAVSTDAGRTWQRSILPGITVNSTPAGPELAASDPAVTYDAAHTVWLAASLTVERGGTHIYVSRSTDGLHWAAPVDAARGPSLDKEWIVCDNGRASPLHGRCYLEFTDDQRNTTMSQSSDDGGLTWSTPVDASGVLVGTQPVVQPDGTLVVVAGDYNGDAALTGSLVSLRSTDGGATFSRATIADLHAASNGVMRAISLPSTGVDTNGTIYAAWHDCRFRPGCSANDIVLATSSDGIAWSAPGRVPLAATSSTLSAFILGLAVDPARVGHLALTTTEYLPSSCRRGGCRLGVAVTTSPDGGKTWTPAQRLEAQPVDPAWLARAQGGRMVGDYLSTTFAGDRIVPVFALAAPPVGTHLREAIFAASLPNR